MLADGAGSQNRSSERSDSQAGCASQFRRGRSSTVRAGHPGLPGKLQSEPLGYQGSRCESTPKLRADGTGLVAASARGRAVTQRDVAATTAAPC